MTTIKAAVVVTTNTHDVTGAVQPLPQFDESASIMAARSLATAHIKRLNIRMANIPEFPYNIKILTKVTELLKPDATH